MSLWTKRLILGFACIAIGIFLGFLAPEPLVRFIVFAIPVWTGVAICLAVVKDAGQ